jgi:hypothetical protein
MLVHKLEIDLRSAMTVADLQEFVSAALDGGAAPSDAISVVRDENAEISALCLQLKAAGGFRAM